MKYVQDNIEGLAVNERAYRIHLSRLRESGELAVPMMIDYLMSKDPAKEPVKAVILRQQRYLGWPGGLNPLLAATETKDDELEAPR